MKTIYTYINEKLTLNKDTKVFQYNYQPKDFNELRSLIEKLLKERGKDADLNDIDISKVTTFGNIIKTGKYKGYSGLFYGLDPHNIDISKWDVRNAEDMSYMFFGCENFNCDLENWDVRNTEDMSWMFYNCKKFNCDLNTWNVRNVNIMNLMFYNCTSLENRPSWYKE